MAIRIRCVDIVTDLMLGSIGEFRKFVGGPAVDGVSSIRCRHPTPAKTMFFATCMAHYPCLSASDGKLTTRACLMGLVSQAA